MLLPESISRGTRAATPSRLRLRSMSRPSYLLAIDQGTTSTRAIVFDAQARAVAIARRELEQHYPASGWRSEEHTSELQSHVNLVCRLLLEKKKKKLIRLHLIYTKISR